MQATKTTGQPCLIPSARQTQGNTAQPLLPPSLETILTGMAHDLGHSSRQTLPATLSNQHTAKILHVSPDTLALWRCTGRYALPYQKIGRYIRYPVQSLAEFIQSRTFCHTPKTGGAA
jgi:hypothetical protein